MSIAVLSYQTVSGATIYFQARLYTDVWFSASADDQQKALNMASAIIDQYAYKGQRTVVTQDREWPRRDLLVQGTWSISFPADQLQALTGVPLYPSDVPPAEILIAESEIALALLSGVDPEAEARNLGVTNRQYASVKTTYELQSIPEYLLAGCPSATAWSYIKMFLSPDNARGITLRRVN